MKDGRIHRSGGFTLVEILIATAIVVFMVVMLGQILSSIQGIWRRSESRTDPFRDARAAIDLMSRELALALTNDKAPVLALENLYSQNNDTEGPKHNQQAYALLPMRNVNKSDLCAVGFYCTWDSGKFAYVLRRHFFSSDATFSRLRDADLPGALSPIGAGIIYAPSSPAKSPALDEDVAAYVWDLKIVPYEYNSGTLAPNTTYPMSYHGTLPQFLEISFKAMSPQAANKLTAQRIKAETWFDTTTSIYKNQILPQTHQFTARIRLHNAIKP
jgi:type II secretory pathway pseudopilin PulG